MRTIAFHMGILTLFFTALLVRMCLFSTPVIFIPFLFGVLTHGVVFLLYVSVFAVFCVCFWFLRCSHSLLVFVGSVLSRLSLVAFCFQRILFRFRLVFVAGPSPVFHIWFSFVWNPPSTFGLVGWLFVLFLVVLLRAVHCSCGLLAQVALVLSLPRFLVFALLLVLLAL